MGLEALSRGFGKSVVFEKNRQVAQIIKSNYSVLNLALDLTIGDSIKLIQKREESFDVIYIDPPYMSGIYENILEWIKSDDKTNNSVIILEHVVELDFTDFEILKQKKYSDKYLTFLHK